MSLYFDLEALRAQFPALHQDIHNHPLVYFDNAATSHKPRAVIDRLAAFYAHENSNVHRGVHTLSQRATDHFEAVRAQVQAFIGAAQPHECLYVRGTTEGINLVANGFREGLLRPGDVILSSEMEHHSNIVPWQIAASRTGAQVIPIPMTDAGELNLDAYERLLQGPVRIVAITHISNVLGTINPVAEMVRMAHAQGVPVLVDGAQAVPHMRVDVQALGADFYVFSAHKMFGPTGIGVLYGKTEWLQKLPPYMGGGNMIARVAFEGTTFNELPHKFEAGTPNIADTIALGAAIDFLEGIGYEAIAAHEHHLLAYAEAQLRDLGGIRIFGQAAHKASVLSFQIDDIHPLDAGTILDRLGIAVRTGHHCCQPLMARLGLPGTLRASFAAYNTPQEIDRLVAAIRKVRQMFG